MDQDGSALKKSPADGYIAIGILVLTLMAVAVGGYLFLRNNNIFGDNGFDYLHFLLTVTELITYKLETRCSCFHRHLRGSYT